MDSRNRLQFDVKLHIWLEGEHRSTTNDVYRRVAQHIINNAIQRKRPLCELPSETNVESFVMGIELSPAEQDVLNHVKELLFKIETLKTQIESVNTECAAITNELLPILSNYLNELPSSED